MIVNDCEQGTPEWFQARLGIPTASQFHRLVTPKTLKPSASARGYMLELIAERIVGPLETYSSGLMGRGSEIEAEAVRAYEFSRDLTTRRVGFVTLDDGSAGCSPDRLIGQDGGLEIKSPGPTKHLDNLLRLNRDYVIQAQGGMFVTGRKWWDIMSYHPNIPEAIYRIERDEETIEALRVAVAKMHADLLDARATLFETYKIDTTPAKPSDMFTPIEGPEGYVPLTLEQVTANLETSTIPF